MRLPKENPIYSDYRRTITIKNQFEAVLAASLEAHQARRMPARLLLAALTSSPEETYTSVLDPEGESIPHNIMLVRRLIGQSGLLEIEVQDPFSTLGMEYPSVILGLNKDKLSAASLKMHDIHGRSSQVAWNRDRVNVAKEVVKKFRRSQVLGFDS